MNINYKNFCKSQISEKPFEKIKRLFPDYVVRNWDDYDPYDDDSFERTIIEYCILSIMGSYYDFYIEDYDEDAKTVELYYDGSEEVSKEDFDIMVKNLSKYGWSVSNYDEVVESLKNE